MKIHTMISSLLIVIALAAGELGAQVTDNSATSHVFAQFADGRFLDGTFYRSTVMVASDSATSTSCTATLFGLTVPDPFIDGTRRTFSLIAGGWDIYRSPGTQTFDSGYMTLVCSAPVTAQVLYTFYSSSGVVLSEATVFSSPVATVAQLIADQRNGPQLGIAIVNNATVAKDFVLQAIDVNSSEVGRRTLQIAGRSQTARFLSELIPTLPANFVGQVLIFTDTTDVLDVYTIGLRYTGNAFTTIPSSVRTPRQ